MTRDPLRGEVADRLAERAAELRRAADSGVLPSMSDLNDGRIAPGDFRRRNWRDAGMVVEIEEVIRRLADHEHPNDGLAPSTTRVEAWLLTRQMDLDAAADELMSELTRGRLDDAGRAQAVVRSAYVIGRAKGIRIAADLYAELAAAAEPHR